MRDALLRAGGRFRHRSGPRFLDAGSDSGALAFGYVALLGSMAGASPTGVKRNLPVGRRCGPLDRGNEGTPSRTSLRLKTGALTSAALASVPCSGPFSPQPWARG